MSKFMILSLSILVSVSFFSLSGCKKACCDDVLPWASSESSSSSKKQIKKRATHSSEANEATSSTSSLLNR